MKFKELSITEFFSVITALSLIVCVITQTYFYYRLNALWVMSFIPPSIYFFEILKIIVIFIICVLLIFSAEECYKRLTKKIRHKKKIRYVNTLEFQKILIENRRKYENYFIAFFSIFTGFCITILSIFRLLSGQAIVIICAAMFGFALILVTDKSLTKGLRYFILALVLFMAAVVISENRFNQISQLPQVKLLDAANANQIFYLLEMSKSNAVLLYHDKNATHHFKIVDLNQIDSIRSAK